MNDRNISYMRAQFIAENCLIGIDDVNRHTHTSVNKQAYGHYIFEIESIDKVIIANIFKTGTHMYVCSNGLNKKQKKNERKQNDMIWAIRIETE